MTGTQEPKQTESREQRQSRLMAAMEVACAGGHNVLMKGSPGGGKTLLARALPSILPRLSLEEALEVTQIYLVADALPADQPLLRTRPFRAPHHTISHAGLVGRGRWPPRARSAWRTAASSFWTSCPSLAASRWRRCASR